jgi:hypothetical protein
MLESNPPGITNRETHQDDEQGATASLSLPQQEATHQEASHRIDRFPYA